MSVLIISGSKSDEPVFRKIADSLEDYTIRVCSAHRTPDFLEKILRKSDDPVIIGVAGLAAHLPGVIASKTTKPVIGVPVGGGFGGLDAFLSIVQMPPGIPVLCTGIDNSTAAAENAKKMMNEYVGVNIIGKKEHDRVIKCTELLEKFNIDYVFTEDFVKDRVNIRFYELGLTGLKDDSACLIINVALADVTKYDDAAKFVAEPNKMQSLWVGMNRGDNAAIAAAEIMRIKELKKYREEMAEKVKNDDKEINS